MATKTFRRIEGGPIIKAGAALKRRDALDAAFVSRLPPLLQVLVSSLLTWATGLAPTSTNGQPPFPGSEVRSFIWMLLALVIGGTAILADTGVPLASWIGIVMLVHGERSFQSVVGHHMTHQPTMLGLPPA